MTCQKVEEETKERGKKPGDLYSQLCAILPKFLMCNYVTHYADLQVE